MATSVGHKAGGNVHPRARSKAVSIMVGFFTVIVPLAVLMGSVGWAFDGFKGAVYDSVGAMVAFGVAVVSSAVYALVGQRELPSGIKSPSAPGPKTSDTRIRRGRIT